MLDGFVPLLITQSLVAANHVHAVIALGTGGPAPVGSSLRAGVHLLPPVAWVVVLWTLGIGVGLLLLVIPGLYLIVRWYVAVQATAVEGTRGSESLGRSGALVRNCFWHAALVALVLMLVPVVLLSVALIGSDALAESLDSGLVQLVAQMLLDTGAFSFAALGSTLLYFDLRARQGEPFASS